jgi:hypothetical protein
MGGAQVLTAWVAMDDATVENGCLHYVSGSHRGPLLPHFTAGGGSAPADGADGQVGRRGSGGGGGGGGIGGGGGGSGGGSSCSSAPQPIDRESAEWSSTVDADRKAALATAHIQDSQIDSDPDPGRRGRGRSYATVRRGGVVFHHGSAVHGSGPNETGGWRRAYSSHWVAQGAVSRSGIMEASRGLRLQAQAAIERREGQPKQRAAAPKL